MQSIAFICFYLTWLIFTETLAFHTGIFHPSRRNRAHNLSWPSSLLHSHLPSDAGCDNERIDNGNIRFWKNILVGVCGIAYNCSPQISMASAAAVHDRPVSASQDQQNLNPPMQTIRPRGSHKSTDNYEFSYYADDNENAYEEDGYYDEEEEDEEDEEAMSKVEEEVVKKNTKNKNKAVVIPNDPMVAFGAVAKQKVAAQKSSSSTGVSDVLNISPDVAFKQYLLPTAFAGAAGYMIKFHMNEDKGVEQAIEMFEKERAEYFNITDVTELEDGDNSTSAELALDETDNGNDDDNLGDDSDEGDNPRKKKRKKKKKGKKKKKSEEPIFSDEVDDIVNEDKLPPSTKPSNIRKPLSVDISAIVDSVGKDDENKENDKDIEDERERLKRLFENKK